MTRRLAIFCVACMAAGGAQAQWSGSILLPSDYRFRGVSLSNDHPAVQGGLGYDDASGWFAGAFASTIKLDANAGHGRQLEAHAGYARRISADVSVEMGATYSNYEGGQGYNYGEIFAGIAAGGISGRIYYSPDYFQQGVQTLYVELNGAHPIARRWELLAHIGALQPISSACNYETCEHGRFDWRAAIHFTADPVGIQLGWAGTDSVSTLYPITGNQHRNNWVLILSATF